MWSDQYLFAPGQLSVGQRISKSAPCSPLKPLIPKRPSCRPDLFHVIYKVPVGDSPYVKAKHVQLVDKDPERAIALFWAAINAGDRVDSALKDMAIVMKQQNRPEEAIEAIKSLRNRCSEQAQESLDNVLLDLYKRCGRLDDQIALLKYKLNLIHQGLAFNGKRTKTARSQGKKFQVSIEQETTRLLGNLGWAYMQQSNYVAAEAVYRKALSIEPDNNKVCNLGICLMKQGRLQEAKTILQSVTPACADSRWGSDSHLKSYDRAQQMLLEMESPTSSASDVGQSTDFSLACPPEHSGLPLEIPLKHQLHLKNDDAVFPSSSLQACSVDYSSVLSTYLDSWEDDEGDDVSVDENINYSNVQEKVHQGLDQHTQWHPNTLKQKLENVRKEKWEDQNQILHPVRYPPIQQQNSRVHINNEAPPFTILQAMKGSIIHLKEDVAVFAQSSTATGFRSNQERLPLIYDRTNNCIAKIGSASPLGCSELSRNNYTGGMNKPAKTLASKAERTLQGSKPSSRRTLSFDSSSAMLPTTKSGAGDEFGTILTSTDIAEDVVVEDMTKSFKDLGFVETSDVDTISFPLNKLQHLKNLKEDKVVESLSNDRTLILHKSKAELETNCRRRLQVFLDMTLPASHQQA